MVDSGGQVQTQLRDVGFDAGGQVRGLHEGVRQVL